MNSPIDYVTIAEERVKEKLEFRFCLQIADSDEQK
jgi:hypothetical protein